MNRMKLSQFTVFVEDYPESGQYLVYNTLTRSLIGINHECFSVLNSLGEYNHTDSSQKTFQKFQELGIIVPAEKNEASSFNEMFTEQRSESRDLHATVLTTLDCPMRCVYCYQGHIEDERPMSVQTTQKFVLWLKTQLQRYNSEGCFITFYGGEPLMNIPTIELIAKYTGEYCRENGIRLTLSMVTSGILLTPSVACKMRDLGVRYLQITLDGDRETHDRRRLLKNGNGTYNLIMKHLEYLVDDFSVTVLCNVDNSNLDAVYRMVDILNSCGYENKLRELIFGPVSSPFESSQGQHTVCPNTRDMDLVSLAIYAAQQGFSSDLRPRHSICGMLLPARFVVDPQGYIYTCPAFLGRAEYQIGRIDREDDYIPLFENFSLGKECLECPYIPFCGVGCRYNALTESGDLMAMDCQREFFAYSLPLMLKAHYSLRCKHGKNPKPGKDSHIPEG